MTTDDKRQDEIQEAERIGDLTRLNVDAEIRKRAAAVDTRGCTIGCLVLLALIVAVVLLWVVGSRQDTDVSSAYPPADTPPSFGSK